MRATAALVAYGRERYPAAVFVPLALLLGVAGLAMGEARPDAGLLPRLGVSASLAWLLVLQFRLGDDLADRDHDRHQFPQRVLVRAPSPAPFVALLAATAALNLALVATLHGAGTRLTALVAIDLALLAWYRWGRPRATHPLLSPHAVLIKYPVLAFIVSPAGAAPSWSRTVAVAALVYVSLGVHEVLHDRRLRAAPGAPSVVAVEAALAALLAGTLAVGLLGRR